MTRKTMPVPQWAAEACTSIAKLLMVTDRIDLHMRPADTEKEWQAQSDLRYELGTVGIDLPYDTYQDQTGYESIIHELLHAMQGDYFAVRSRALILAKLGDTETSLDLLDKVNERFIERLSWVIYALIFCHGDTLKMMQFEVPKVPPEPDETHLQNHPIL